MSRLFLRQLQVISFGHPNFECPGEEDMTTFFSREVSTKRKFVTHCRGAQVCVSYLQKGYRYTIALNFLFAPFDPKRVADFGNHGVKRKRNSTKLG